MPRAMWKGAISFGLVSIPIQVFPATEEKSLRFNQLHDEDHGRIKYQRICAKDGQEVPFEHIVKGYEFEKDQYVVLADEDLEAVKVPSTKSIDILQFVDIGEIDPMYFKKSYYLVPQETGVKPYALLRDALGEDGKVGIAKVAFRDASKEQLAALRVHDDVFVLETMFWPDELRAAQFDELDKEVSVRPQEVQMARALIENLSEEWNPEAYRDEYREALLEIVEKKVAGEEIEVAPEEEPSAVMDIMEALKASVEATKAEARGRGGRAAKKAPAKRAARPRPAAKKAAAKKAS